MRGEVCYTLKKDWMYASSVDNTLFFLRIAFPTPWNVCFCQKWMRTEYGFTCF